MMLRRKLRFSRFTRKGYGLFSVLGKEVLIGTLSIATLQHAKAEGISVQAERTDASLQRTERSLDEVVVTGSRAPLTQGEAAKIVSVITRDDIHRAAAETVNDVLKMATGVDVRQRGGFGVQTDISIGGGTFDQIAILLNGVNIGNPQTGHLSADIPVSLDDIVRVEVIEGAASRVYGASAFNGAINIVTTGSEQRGMHGNIALQGGSFGTFGLSARGNVTKDKWSNSLSASYMQSDGAVDNGYFRKSHAYYQGSYSASKAQIRWQLGGNTKRYGANTFYSAAYPNQYESNARLFASVSGETYGKVHILPTLYWQRSYDHFQLTRGLKAGENFNRVDVYGVGVNAYTDWQLGRTAFGAELRHEKLYSGNLGHTMDEADWFSVTNHPDINYTKSDRRTDISAYVEHNVLLRRFTASFGVMANRNTSYNNAFRFYPGVDLSYRPADKWKLTASWNMAFRLPTFTDLYYKSPTQEGNKDLKPEKTNSLRLGAQYRTTGVEARLTGFYDWGTDMIDWVMYTADDTYHSANFRLDNRGYSVAVTLFPQEWMPTCIVTAVKLGYAYIDQNRKDDTQIYKSNYAMEYLRHKFTASVDHRIVSRLTASWAFRWQQRMGSYIVYENNKSTGRAHAYSPYGILDLKLMWTERRYELALSMNNLTSHSYYDLGNVEQPGFWLMGSAKWKF